MRRSIVSIVGTVKATRRHFFAPFYKMIGV
jgi:hypothetical protein